ncbi:MAG: hypothetical protein A3B23_00160 [Candidatus Colwellbacteria bacterium RIFCSPLOWO2_01_FULL_48_10]|uniref:Uncharacterized protein n=1 Tax=Candidatus Colwellbacteria bacterium RIFCSPLOWO2_01_FULL_48_10 TaxID=1797690 RepID=A0A1G1Z6C8_9BACT|nr:MAG: hypothetical protein A3B23_00160 [Candidatus Colwellbacteria bacterium RIFCSPLOWO2_01_FULL_48_10]
MERFGEMPESADFRPEPEVRSSFVKESVENKEKDGKESPPEGWMTMWGLIKRFGFGDKTFSKIAGKYLDSHPEMTGVFLSSKGVWGRHYSPELIELVKKELESRGAPEGWLNMGQIHLKLRRNYDNLRITAMDLLDKNPEEGRFAVNKGGKTIEYFSPVLVAKIEQAFEEKDKYESPPEGWVHKTDLSKIIFASRLRPRKSKDLTDAVGSFRNEHPEWFQNFMGLGGSLIEYYHPDLVKKVRDIFIEREAKFTSKLQRSAR